jgi:hypothetical protein
MLYAPVFGNATKKIPRNPDIIQQNCKACPLSATSMRHTFHMKVCWLILVSAPKLVLKNPQLTTLLCMLQLRHHSVRNWSDPVNPMISGQLEATQEIHTWINSWSGVIHFKDDDNFIRGNCICKPLKRK